MIDDNLYDRWRRRRTEVEPGPSFADQILDTVRRHRQQRTQPLSLGVILLRILSSPVVRAAACVLACLVCLFRMVQVVAVFFVQ
jgi:hypothetical protein